MTYAAAQQTLANRLYDPTMTFWSQTEIGLYLQEALRTWNAFTSYWRDDFIFPLQQNVTFYDMSNLVAMPTTPRPFTVLDTNLYTQMLYHLLEPPTGIASLQFSQDDLIAATMRRRDEILSITGCTTTLRYVSAVAGRIQLPDSVIDVRRVTYLPTQTGGIPYGTGLYGVGPYGGNLRASVNASVLWPEDTWAEQSFQRLYPLLPAGSQPLAPSVYLLSTQPPISFDVDVPPSFGGQYELLTIEAGPQLLAGSPSLLSIPDDWTHVLKWGALADLLSRESNAKDPSRAAYCEQRYRMGTSLLSTAPAILAMRVGNVPLQIDAITAGDQYNTSWEMSTPGAPQTIYTAGMNILAASPVSDIGPYSLTATVVRNAPLPSLPGDYLQCGRDDLDAIIDYAQHLAAFKMGGLEFTATLPLFQRFLKQASQYGLKLAELGEYTSVIFGQAQRDDQMHPRMAPTQEPS